MEWKKGRVRKGDERCRIGGGYGMD